MCKISVFEEIQYSFKILTHNDFLLPDHPDLIPVDSSTLKSFALKKFWDKLWTLAVPSGECSLCRRQLSHAEHLIQCTAPHKTYDEFVLPLVESYMRQLDVCDTTIGISLELFSRLNPTWSVALFRSILPFSLVEALLTTLPTALALPILNRWSTLTTLWIYVELYLPLKNKEERLKRRMSIEYILNEADADSDTNSDSDESYMATPNQSPQSSKPSQYPAPPDSDFDCSLNPVFCI
ncbi:hypothetical protein K493DRAFT_305430 [Basidiobolus meristosporus CBS 931.73]|uniref:Uncharacterized protein n=1 Tax=Basidiobolus meristosporus CBS 931.73 TaxID=1314790 RepID=A0A1Y1XVQ2_9FUNG|nr:hypothetical protein K493DRAFT_305430 [Basidiobolus meristosporus CBS 931.73]|eukprot:ORX89841.1 hypothetical protein K493DRAFT_305430 [Basidiobolus meristosporus CBS 931.73]